MQWYRIACRMVGVVALVGLLALAGCMLLQPRVVVDFEAAPASGMSPHLVDFTPIVEEPVTTYEWDFGDGETSTEAAPTSPIVWLDRSQGKIYSGPRGGGEISTVLSGIYMPNHIAVADEKVYWTAPWKVGRASLDGSGRETIFYDPGQWDMVGIAVDPVASKVYWVQGATFQGHPTQIWKANLDGSRAAIFATKAEWRSNDYGPWLLAMDSAARKLYWYEMNQPYDGPTIPLSTPEPLDWEPQASVHWTPLGAFVDHEIAGGLSKTEALALDVGLPDGAGYVYWTNPVGNLVLRSRSEVWLPVSPVYVYLITESPEALAIDADEGKIYWSSSDGIHRASMSDRSDEELIYPGVHADAIALDM